jgi:hypothetical protein
VINDLDQEEVSPPVGSVNIVLTGDDLQILEAEAAHRKVGRRVIVEVVYNSDIGSGLTLNDEAAFVLENLTKIT